MVLSFVTFFNERLDTQRHRYERLLGFRFCFYDILTDILFYFYRLVWFFVKYFLGPFLCFEAQSFLLRGRLSVFLAYQAANKIDPLRS